MFEQTLRRVRVPPVAGIHHVHIGATEAAQVLDDQVGRARRYRGARQTCSACMPRGCRSYPAAFSPLAVEERATSRLMTSAERGAWRRSRRWCARARRIFEEQVEDALAAQERDFLHVAVGDFEETRCGVEDLRQDGTRQSVDRQEMRQLTVGVELRVMHGRRTSTAIDRAVPPAPEPSSSAWPNSAFQAQNSASIGRFPPATADRPARRA